MATIISKKKGNKLYYYVVESARVDGKPRIVQHAGGGETMGHFGGPRRARPPRLDSDENVANPAKLIESPSQ